AKAALQKSRLTGDAVFIERLRICAKDGSWRAVSGTARRLIAGTVVDHLVTLHDVTNLLGLERQLEAADRVQSLGRVAANVTHEFRNILMGLDVNIKVIARTQTDPRGTAAAETLLRLVRRGSSIAEEILRFSSPAALH